MKNGEERLDDMEIRKTLHGMKESIQERTGKTSFLRTVVLFVVIYAAAALLLYWIVAKDWSETSAVTDAVNRDALLPEMSQEDEILQTFTDAFDRLDELTLAVNSTPGNEGTALRVILQEGADILWEQTVSAPENGGDGNIYLQPEGLPDGLKGKRLTLRIQGGEGVSFWYGATRSAGKVSVDAVTEEKLSAGGVDYAGELVMTQAGTQFMPYTAYYWPVAAALGVLILLGMLIVHARQRRQEASAVGRGVMLMQQYRYLLKTLVVRDFKVRYKASVLGVLWSFLNPLLMTFVYLFVFSTLFRSSIPNFPVYLLSGIILFNYFSEATNMGMQSIVGNAGLITKVYIPKYIFPISKAISSAINLVISLIPLLLMMLVTGTAFHKSLLLMPLVILFLVIFCIGVSLILSAIMVYFRDIQFLWGIVVTVLNFFSPIFYPESIIPAQFLKLYHVNPLYQFLFFMRTIVIGGISPTPVTYLYCILASFGTLAVGLLIFRRAQSRFVLHL